ncbi:hypothetical protein [Falsiroseomonas sp.]|uniref:hypothetical protein n=1 Tax=Falsiroseomonas sp. TaxID=2870721 RepID=UPI003569478D
MSPRDAASTDPADLRQLFLRVFPAVGLALDGATLRARRREKFLEMGRAGVV